jgi:tetratricopeptide (TPR) repeat protein
MRRGVRIVFSLLVLAGLISSAPALALQGGVIEGRVIGPNGQPVENAHVTLTDDGYAPLGSKYTDAGGRFRFSVSSGVYYVDVDPAGQPYQSQRQRVEVNPAPYSRGGEIFRVDMTLAPTRAASDRAPATGGRFAQDVPEPARKEYERGVKLLSGKRDEAFAAMRKALELYPDYYLAMETLGTELVKAGKYADAAPVLSHAVEVNPSGDASHYALGVLRYRTGKYADAATSLRHALALNPKSPNTTLYLGLALTRTGETADAETYLKRAYALGAKGVPDLHLALASIYITAKRNREAADQLRLLIKEVPDLRDRDKIKALIEKLDKA